MPEFSHAGTLVHGTHRPQDLIPAFIGALTELAPERATALTAQYPVTIADPEADYFLGADALVRELFDALEACAPEGWYFGAIEGDGSDFGFWRAEEESILPPGQSLGTWANDA